jgi:hypothetical protein
MSRSFLAPTPGFEPGANWLTASPPRLAGPVGMKLGGPPGNRTPTTCLQNRGAPVITSGPERPTSWPLRQGLVGFFGMPTNTSPEGRFSLLRLRGYFDATNISMYHSPRALSTGNGSGFTRRRPGNCPNGAVWGQLPPLAKSLVRTGGIEPPSSVVSGQRYYR